MLYALRRIIRAVDLHSRRLVARHKVTGPQLVCLMALKESGSATPSAIARKVHLSPSTVIGIVDRLETRGLVRRERDRRDRRLVHVALTEEGGRLAANAPSPLQDTLAEAMRDLPEPEQATIASSLDRVVEMMEIGHVDAAPILTTEPVSHTAVAAGPPESNGGAETEP